MEKSWKSLSIIWQEPCADIFVKLRYPLWDILNQSHRRSSSVRVPIVWEKTTYWRSDVLLTFWKMAATSKVLYAARSNNTGGRWSLMCSITYFEYISTRQFRWLLLQIDAINDHCGGAATLSRLDLVEFDKNDNCSFPVILEYSNMEP